MPGRPSKKLSAIQREIQDFTEGQPYAFVVSPFERDFSEIFDVVESVARGTLGLRCIRGDRIKGQAEGSFLLEKIHTVIKGSRLVIADVTKENANVLYEVGYASGLHKHKDIVFIAREDTPQMPTNLSGKEFLVYGRDSSSLKKFRSELSLILKRFDPDSAHLRAMLVAEKGPPTYIVASPKPGAPGEAEDRRTFGDNLGIRGLLAAFGLFFGLNSTKIELISGLSCPPNLLDDPANLFLIGSPEVNRLVKDGLSRIQTGGATTWRFEKLHDEWVLYRQEDGKPEGTSSKKEYERSMDIDGKLILEDHGIIVRAPHPLHPGRLIMVLAGPSSVGTGAACLAATQSQLIRKIADSGIDIADHRRGFWVLVKGKADPRDHLLNESGVSVEASGFYPGFAAQEVAL